MDVNSWLTASGERSHLLPRVEQSYIYEPRIPGPSTAPLDAWSAAHLEAGPARFRITPPSDFSVNMLLAPRGPAAEERPIAPSPAHVYPPDSPAYLTRSSSTESLESMDDDSLSENEEYKRYEKMALEELERRRGGPLLSSNPRMRREVAGANHSSSDDAANSTDADCSVPRPVSGANVTSSAHVTSSADVYNSADAASHTNSAKGTSSSKVSSSTAAAPSPTDDTYRRRRNKNNHAAKLSRDRRRLRETTLKIREAFLKMKLREDLQLYETVRHQRSLAGISFEL